MVGGQEHDMASAKERLPLELVLELHAMKTGALFRAAVVGGGLAADADDAQLALLDRYGRSLGRAFQLTDDLLDLGDSPLEQDTGDDHENAVNLAVRLGAQECQERAGALVDDAIEAAGLFGNSGQMLVELASMIQWRKS